MIRESLLFLFTCGGVFLAGRYSLFNFSALIIARIHNEDDLASEKKHAAFAAVMLGIVFVLISMLFGISLFFFKILALFLFFALGLLLAVQSDLKLISRSEDLYRKKEQGRIKGEFFFWLGVLVLIFVLSVFVFI